MKMSTWIVLSCIVWMVLGINLEAAASAEETSVMTISKDVFGKLPDGRTADLYTIENGGGLKAKVTNYGGILVALETPDQSGKSADIVLGLDTLDDYVTKNSPYFGAACGRFANRIKNGKFSIDGVEYQLAANNGPHHLHGGIVGYNKVLWDAREIKTADEVGLKLTYLSKDGEENYPGNLSIAMTYTLTKDNAFKITYEAKTDKATPINLTHHSYFNLAGQGNGDILGQEVMIDADRYTAIDELAIPTGELASVKGTPLDFTTPMAVGARIEQAGGYDHNYVLNSGGGKLALAAKITDPGSGRVMEVWTTEPGIQFYSGNFLDGTLTGKGGKVYKKNYGFCFETQHFPDSPNHANFPNTILRPGDRYAHTCIYKFGVK